MSLTNKYINMYKQMTKERHKELKEEIETLRQIDWSISDIINKQEEEKDKVIKVPYKVERVVEKYHTLKATDLPLYKKFKFHHMNRYYLYRLSVIDGKQRLHKMMIDDDNKKVSLYEDDLHTIFDDGNKPSDKKEWDEAVCKLLNVVG